MLSSERLSESFHLDADDIVAVRTSHKEGNTLHWTLGKVESYLLNTDIEISLCEKKREALNEDEVSDTHEGRELLTRLKDARRETQKHIQTTDTLIEQLRGCRAELKRQLEVADGLVLKFKAAVSTTRRDVEKIRALSWNELKSYRDPPKAVVMVVRAVMLLLSEDEAHTWVQMRRVLQDTNFRQRILHYDPERELSANRSEYILQECINRGDFNRESMRQCSVALSSIYNWVLAQLNYREALTRKDRIVKTNLDRREEYLALLNELTQEEAHIAELRATEEDLDCLLRLYCAQATASNLDDPSTNRRQSNDDIAADRYENSFAGKARRTYLQPAFYQWEQTDRITFVMWENILTNFGPILPKSRGGYFLSESQIRVLDDALTKGSHRPPPLDSVPPLELKKNIVVAPCTPKSITERFQRRIKGSRWNSVLARKRSEIEHALREDTSECLGVPIGCIDIFGLRLGSLIVDLEITHDGTRKRSAIQKLMNAFKYSRVMSLYEDDVKSTDVAGPISGSVWTEDSPSRHQAKLAGELWGELLLRYPTPLMKGLFRDISEATGIEQDKVKIVDIHGNEKNYLTVRYVVLDRSIDAAEVDRMCEAYAFPHTWALYRRRTGTRGGKLVVLLARETPQLSSSSRDTSAISYQQGIPVELESRSEKGRATFLKEYGCPPASSNDKTVVEGVVHRAASQDKPLSPFSSYNGSDTIYVKNFEGNYWSAAYSSARPALMEAFRADTADALDIPSWEVEIHDFTYTPTCLRARFKVPPHGVSPRSVWSKVNAFEYSEVWSLYNEIVYDQKSSVGQFKQVFNGKDWPLVLLNKKKELQEVFVREACQAMGLSPLDVSVQNITADENGALIHYQVISQGDFAHDVNSKLKDYAFPNVWALYTNQRKSMTQETNMQEITDAPRVNENLTQFFEGNAWGDILKEYRPKVEAAFKEDQVVCLGIQLGNILIRSAEATHDGLVMFYNLKGVHCTHLEVEKKSKAYHYPRIWALYEKSWTLKHYRVVFEGENWGRVLEGRKSQFEAVFASCTAELFDLKAHHVRNVEFTFGSLIVEFDLYHPSSLPAEEIDRKLAESRYDPLWAIYSEQVAGSTERSVATTHTLSFEGEHWGNIVNEQKSRLHEAVHLDASEALSLPRECINEVRMDPTDKMLGVRLTVHHPISQAESDIEHALSLWSYERVWSLYPMASSNPTLQLPCVLPPASFNLEYQQTSTQPIQRMRETQSASFPKGMAVAKEAYVSGGMQFVRTLSVPRNNGAQSDLPRDSLMKSGNQHQKDPSVKLQPYLEANANKEGFTTATAGNSRARNGVVVGVTQRGVGSTVCDAHNPDELVCCFKGSSWNIWLDESPSNDQTAQFPCYTVIFQGKGWDYVIRNRYLFLKDAFCEEVSCALCCVAKNAICETSFIMDKEHEMIARFRLPEAAVVGLSESDVYIRLNTYPYRKVWTLYDEPTAMEASNETNSLSSTNIVTTHDVGFEASNWEVIDWLRHDEIVAAFKQDTARAVRLHTDDVDVREVSLYRNLLHIRVQLQHSAKISSAELKERMLEYNYAEVWRLYEKALEGGQESGVLVKVFEGDQWGPIVSSNGASLAKSFCTGISRCLQIPRACVTVLNLTVGSLVVEYTVRSNLSDAAIWERTAAYLHPEVWSFYEYSHIGNAVNPYLGLTACFKTLQRTFKGKNWGILVCRRCNMLKNLFVRDTSSILKVPNHEIHVISLCFTNGNLVVNYSVSLTRISKEAAEKLVNQAEYPRLWSLYRFHDYENFEKTQHKVKFKGENWGLLLEHNIELLMNTFALCTIATLGLEQSCIDNLRVELKPYAHNMEFSFTLWHPKTMSAWAIDRTLKKFAYKRVWALEQCNHADRVKTSLSVLFTGPFWRNTPGAKWPELRQAFAQNVANALGMSRTDVKEVHMGRGQDGIRFSAQVMHYPGLSAGLLQSVLDRNDFPDIYSIQSMWHSPNDEDYIASIHRVDFEADRWPEVMKCRRELVFNALCIDAAAALGVALQDVDILSMDTIESRLSCAVKIIHPVTQTTDEIQGKLNEFSYTHIWALYEASVQPRVDVLKTRHADSTSMPLERYMGDEMPSQDFILRVRNAFIEDTSCALKCAPSEIIIDGIQIGELAVHYHVVGYEKPMKTAVLAESCQYPNLNTLLRLHEISAISALPMHTSN